MEDSPLVSCSPSTNEVLSVPLLFKPLVLLFPYDVLQKRTNKNGAEMNAAFAL